MSVSEIKPKIRMWRMAGVIVLSLVSQLLTQACVVSHVRAQDGFRHGVVAADHPAASEAGASILRQGGNAVDAAVATSFALSVTRPASCGIGGGGFMVIWDAKRMESVALDYRERAPAAVTIEMLSGGLPDDSAPPEPVSVRGGLAVGVPGTVAGLCTAAERYGTMPLARLLEPAIRLCIEGVETDAHDREVQAQILRRFRQFPDYDGRFAALKRLYLNDGRPWQKGDRFYSPQRRILEMIAERGPEAFYTGVSADRIVETVSAEGGVLTHGDLSAFVPVERQPLISEFHGRTIVTMPPPSSGGIALLQTLQSLEAWEALRGRRLADYGRDSADYVHVVTEVLKHAFADRAEFLGDTDFVRVPVDRLLDRGYALQIAQRVHLDKTLPTSRYGRFFLNADSGTSHFSVMDNSGNAVACTETINLTFGSFVVVPELGILLNNQMDDFTASPGKANAFGLIQSEANAVQPGKKPLSSMTPLIVVQDGRATYACGASGGPRIITATLQNFLNHVLFGLNPSDAVSAPRFHHQWAPDELLLEPQLFERIGAELTSRGHRVVRSTSLAATQAAARSDTIIQGGSDPRKHGQPAGY